MPEDTRLLHVRAVRGEPAAEVLLQGNGQEGKPAGVSGMFLSVLLLRIQAGEPDLADERGSRAGMSEKNFKLLYFLYNTSGK